MGVIELASGTSFWRGVSIAENKGVLSIKKTAEEEYQAVVKGSNNNTYDVYVNENHARKSTCTCPHANGRRIICKHIIATYLTANPRLLKVALDQRTEYEKEYYEREDKKFARLDEYRKKLEKKVKTYSDKEVRAMLVNYMLEPYEKQLDKEFYLDEEDEDW